MSNSVKRMVIELVEGAGDRGAAMGAIVDELVARGHRAQDVEAAIWTLLGERRLTPHGYIARTMVQRTDADQRPRRVYEFLLVPWSPHLDRQLDLALPDESA